MSLWTPALITTGLWLDAEDTDTVTESGGSVSQWDDKSGNGRNATQGTASNQPTYSTSKFGGKYAMSMDGVNDYFEMGTGLDFLAGVDHSAFLVITRDGGVADNLYGAQNGSAGSNSLHVGFTNNTNYRMNYWGNDYQPSITNFQATGSVMNYIWDAGTSKTIYADGNLEGTSTSPTPGTIGTMSGGGHITNVVGQGYHQGHFAEIVIIVGVPTTDTRQKMEGYLAWKWGLEGNLPSTHPYKSYAPRDDLWTPQQVIGKLGGWWDASDDTTVTESAGRVSQWDDKSTVGEDLTQGVGADQPYYGSRTQQDRNVMDFQGSEWIDKSFTAHITQPFAIFTAFKFDDVSANNYIYDGDDGTDRATLENWSNLFNIWAGGTEIGDVAEDTNPHIMYGQYNGASSESGLDGDLTPATGNAGSNDSGGLTVGSRYNQSVYLDGWAGEIIICNGIVSKTNKEKMEGYLAWKWGLQGNLPVGHTYKNAPPTIGGTINLRGQFNTNLLGGFQ